jgi:hypothetical protein
LNRRYTNAAFSNGNRRGKLEGKLRLIEANSSMEKQAYRIRKRDTNRQDVVAFAKYTAVKILLNTTFNNPGHIIPLYA